MEFKKKELGEFRQILKEATTNLGQNTQRCPFYRESRDMTGIIKVN